MSPFEGDFTGVLSRDLCELLERFVPEVLRDQHPEWAWEGLDGVLVAQATRTGDGTLRLVGSALLITDQRLTPFLAEISLSDSEDAALACEVKVGEPGGGLLGISGPPWSNTAVLRHQASVLSRLDRMEWVFRVERPPRTS